VVKLTTKMAKLLHRRFNEMRIPKYITSSTFSNTKIRDRFLSGKYVLVVTWVGEERLVMDLRKIDKK